MKSDAFIPTVTECYHCGEECKDEAVHLNDKHFCCTGCKLVYEILDENELNTYYSLDAQPGTSQRKDGFHARFDYLEDSSITERLTDFKDGDNISVRLYIPNIHCTSCVWLMENLFKLDDGIAKSSVNFLKRELSVTYNESQTSLRAIAELLSSIGYEPEFRLENLDKKKPLRPNRRLWLKLGVAGFSFGNIMLFSFPEYLSGSSLNAEGSFYTFFGVMNIVLALPVLFYSSSDYLKSGWAAIKQGGINLDVPISIGIITLFSRSLFEIITGTGAGYLDSFTGLVFFLLIGRIIQKKTYERLSFDRDFKSYLPISVTVLNREGSERTVSLEKLKKGNRMLIRNQELIPADAILMSENSFIDYSFITGESDPVEVKQGDSIYAGGKVIGPSVEMSIVKEVSASYLTELWNDSAFDKKNRKVSTLADRISPYFTFAVISIAMIAGFVWWLDSSEMGVSVFTAVLIIACPCALALSTPFTLGSALNIFSKNGMYIKGIEAIESLANATSVVFDKTGTLTKANQAEMSTHGIFNDEDLQIVKSVCRQSLHPLSQKIASGLKEIETVPLQNFSEIVNKGMTAKARAKTVIIGSASFLEEHSVTAGKPHSHDKTVSRVEVAIDGKWVGRFEISNSYRPGIRELVDTLKKSFTAYLLSGDNDSQKENLTGFFDETSLRFNQTPRQKLDFIKNLQAENQKVIMIGDGLNDAGALQQSDFGIALTDDITSFTPACDAILDGSSLQKLNTLVQFSRKSITIIKYSFGLSLLYNVVGLSFAVAGHLTPLVAAILMPLSSISILLFTTGSTWLTAKKMGLVVWE